MEDEERIGQFRQGDIASFDLLYRRYRDRALRAAYLICGSYSEAEDVVQETFVMCYKHWNDLRDSSKFWPWLLKTLTRTAWRFCRKRRQEEPVAAFFEEADRAGESALMPVLREERQRLLYQALYQLDEKHRTVVILYYWDEMSVREIAQVMGCLEGTVKSRLFHARRQLRQVIGEEEAFEEVLNHEKGYV